MMLKHFNAPLEKYLPVIGLSVNTFSEIPLKHSRCRPNKPGNIVIPGLTTTELDLDIYESLSPGLERCLCKKKTGLIELDLKLY